MPYGYGSFLHFHSVNRLHPLNDKLVAVKTNVLEFYKLFFLAF